MTQRERSRRLIPLALLATVAAYLGWASGQRPAFASSPSAALRHRAGVEGGGSCALSVATQVKAVKAFREMMPVFRHDRCLNCHGGFDIRDTARHAGADFAINAGLDQGDFLTAEERRTRHESCGSCHSTIEGSMTRLDNTALEGWLLAPPPMRWDGKSDEALCLDMKRFEAVGDSFVDHLETDHGEIQFIKAAFEGVRALSAKDIEAYGVTKEPPPGSQAELVAQASAWVELLEGHWKNPPECGCVMPELTLRIHHRSAINPGHTTHQAGHVGFSGDAEFEVTLTRVHEAQGRIYYTGEKSLVRPLEPYFAAQGCQGTASQAEEWLVSAEVDTAFREMRLRWSFTTSDETGHAVCIRGGHRSEMGLEPSIFAGESDEPLVVPLDSEAATEGTWREKHGLAQEWLSVQVVGNANGSRGKSR